MAVSDAILRRLERRAGMAGLVAALADRLRPHELTSLLLAVFGRRAHKTSPATVLQRWERDAFVRPSSVPVGVLASTVTACIEAAAAFEVVELSPLCPLGTCSVLAPVDQDNVVGTARSSEVVSDPTNVLALECAIRRRAAIRLNPRDATRVRLAANHRVVRAQRFAGPGMFQHFRLFAACTAGRDEGNNLFELEAFTEHVALHVDTLARLRGRGFEIPDDERIRIVLQRPPGAPWMSSVAQRLHRRFPRVEVEVAAARRTAYYPTCSFTVEVDETRIADGGVVEWTAALLSNEKERLCISGLGIDRACSLWGGAAAGVVSGAGGPPADP